MRALLALVLCSCASTTVRDPATGRVVFSTQADAQNITYSGNGQTFHADTLVHSTPTIAGGRAANGIIQSAGTMAGAIGAAVATGRGVK
jgi:hypothetical protein